MLHYQTLETSSFAVLMELMQNKLLKDTGFVLAGGTALALQLGHRMSTDLDLFTALSFDTNTLSKALQETFGNRITITAKNEIGFRGFIDDVKIDVLHFKYQGTHQPIVQDGLRILPVEAIAALKVHAVANRGLRRDFVDLAEILQKKPLESVLQSYYNQFRPSPSAFNHTMSALTYFNDAERTPQKIEVKNGRKWEDTKKIVLASVNKPGVLHKLTPPITVKPGNPHVRQAADKPAQTLNNQTSQKLINAGTKPLQRTQAKKPRSAVKL